MKKLVLLLAIGVLCANCVQEEVTEQASADLTAKTTNKDLDVVPNRYFGVLSTFDTQIHGELRIDLGADTEFQAIVTLVNKDVLKFKAIVNKKNPAIVDFKGSTGSFTMDFGDKRNIVTTNFLVDNKEGYIGAFPEPRRGGSIFIGSYVDSSDPAFSGNWDMMNFGRTDPTTGLPIIENIVISHTGGLVFPDETAGVFEPFSEDCVYIEIMVGAQTDGFGFFARNQIATFNSIPTIWNMNTWGGIPIDLNTCIPTAGPPQGTWTRGARSGTLAIL